MVTVFQFVLKLMTTVLLVPMLMNVLLVLTDSSLNLILNVLNVKKVAETVTMMDVLNVPTLTRSWFKMKMVSGIVNMTVETLTTAMNVLLKALVLSALMDSLLSWFKKDLQTTSVRKTVKKDLNGSMKTLSLANLVTRPAKSVKWTEPVSSVMRTPLPLEILFLTSNLSRDMLQSERNAKLSFVTKKEKTAASHVSMNTMKTPTLAILLVRLAMLGLSTMRTPILVILLSAMPMSSRMKLLKNVKSVMKVAMVAMDLIHLTVTNVRMLIPAEV